MCCKRLKNQSVFKVMNAIIRATLETHFIIIFKFSLENNLKLFNIHDHCDLCEIQYMK